MAYKYPTYDVFHWFSKIARFFVTEQNLLISGVDQISDLT
jgi:hypothetical protein